jgi:hypothetical protein
MTRRIYPEAGCYGDALAHASRDRTAWSAAERAALGRLSGAGAAPLIAMRRRKFFADGRYTFVVERAAGRGFAVARVAPGLFVASAGPRDLKVDLSRASHRAATRDRHTHV